jgi:Na+/H+ antiporter NhaD/arsenite permease-like protein
MILAAGLVWVLVAWMAESRGLDPHHLREAVAAGLDDYGGLALFLLAAMTYIAALDRLHVFDALRLRLIHAKLSYTGVFWATGVLAFFLSAVADNLTTALVMGTVVATVGAGQPRFVAVGLVNVVVAANAGGAFSPFGDLTTLMVWQAGKLGFTEFFHLFVPSLVAFAVPALLLGHGLPQGCPVVEGTAKPMRRGAKRTILLGLLTIALAVTFEQTLHLPAYLGMMLGLGLLMLHFYDLRRTRKDGEPSYDVFKLLARVDWDTLLFFFGIIFCVGALGFVGYLDLLAHGLYDGIGSTAAHILLGVASAVIDNVPVMFAVLNMDPELGPEQWLLVTLTVGIGGSLLSIGSAAGVALMGVAQGAYTFSAHLRATPAIALGFAAAIATHLLMS